MLPLWCAGKLPGISQTKITMFINIWDMKILYIDCIFIFIFITKVLGLFFFLRERHTLNCFVLCIACFNKEEPEFYFLSTPWFTAKWLFPSQLLPARSAGRLVEQHWSCQQWQHRWAALWRSLYLTALCCWPITPHLRISHVKSIAITKSLGEFMESLQMIHSELSGRNSWGWLQFVSVALGTFYSGQGPGLAAPGIPQSR